MSSESQARTILEPARELPVAAEVDVLVVGGGPAGLGAALAAAREGASALLVERNGFLGGVATAALMTIFLHHREHLSGISREIVDELVRCKGGVAGRVINFDPEAFKEVALELVEAAGVKLLLYSWAVAPVVQDGVVRGAIVENKSGRRALLAKTTIDCTGDADLAYQAGVPVVKGRETDGKMRPISLIFRMGNIDFRPIVEFAKAHPDQFSRDPNFQVLDLEGGVLRISGFFDLVEQGRQSGELDKDCHYLRFEGVDVQKGICFINDTRVYQVDGTNGWDLTRTDIEARKQIRLLVDFIRKYVPGCQNAFVVDTAANLGVRETRRIRGEYVFDEADIVANRVFEDRVVQMYNHVVQPGVELHSPDAGEGSAQDPHGRTILHQEHSFFMPYRSLVPRSVEGLLVAGRCISQTHEADKWTRSMPCCIEMGEAGGTAAAVAAADGVTARSVDVAKVQRKLADRGVPLFEPLAQPVPVPTSGRNA
ncbi:MAG: FAD-dependent oxidoreductase [Chloroflexi bacterium]|nr:FAD-dependent oxidoreductase [Chloroflexota bacterium]